MRWKFIGTTMKGTIHQNNGIKCQDRIDKYMSDQFACVAMADGAGSVSRAYDGAELAVKETTEILKKLGERLFSAENEEIASVLLSHLGKRFDDTSRLYNCRKGELASTLMFFACNGNRYVAGNIGDGMVGSIGSDGCSEIILNQEQGPYANYSFFLTDDDCMSHLRITKGEYDPDRVYFLLTDGSCDCLYNPSDATFAKALHKFAGWTRRYPFHDVWEAIIQNMHRLFPKRTSDDCALALLTTGIGRPDTSHEQSR